jgi:hypothetical protein
MYYSDNFCCIEINKERQKGYYADISMHAFEMPLSVAKYLIGKLNNNNWEYAYNLIDYAEKICIENEFIQEV